MDAYQFQRHIVARQGFFHDADPTIEWWTLALVGEAGELANQVKKIWRDDNGELTCDRREKLIDELGDVLAYSAALANALQVDLANVMAENVEKIERRIQRGTAKGSGDDR